MAVKHLYQCRRHGHVHRPAQHFCQTPERHIQAEQSVQVRRASGLGPIHLSLEDAVGQAAHPPVGIAELGKGIIQFQRRCSIPPRLGKRPAQKSGKFPI